MQAVLQDTSSVCLWLGANVMLEYPLQEAHDLLAKNYDNAKTSLESIKKDMLTLRDSITTTEARLVCIIGAQDVGSPF
jgi:prefoldin subunit 5